MMLLWMFCVVLLSNEIIQIQQINFRCWGAPRAGMPYLEDGETWPGTELSEIKDFARNFHEYEGLRMSGIV